ncbi:MAG: hypothetical protein WD335_01615 [Candidatus Paceibacterota bacterium]
MKKSYTTILASLTSLALPIITQAVTYDENGAAILGGEPTPPTENLLAAVGGANLSFTCLAIVILMLVTMYIFHEIWHPQRQHETMTRDEIRRGSVQFYIGGSILWMLIAIMAEVWCTILPLGLLLAAGIVYYLIAVSMSPEDN